MKTLATFLEALNNILRDESVISGDDGDITSFSDSQHSAAINLAKRAITKEMASLAASRVLPYEEVDGSLDLIPGARFYDLPSDFIQFVDECPAFQVIENSRVDRLIYEMAGGEEKLKRMVIDYKTQEGDPTYWYKKNATTKQVAFYPIPDEALTLNYQYQRNILPVTEEDNLPFHNDMETELFTTSAGRQFKYLFASVDVREQLFPKGITRDEVLLEARASLVELMTMKIPRRHYGNTYAQSSI